MGSNTNSKSTTNKQQGNRNNEQRNNPSRSKYERGMGKGHSKFSNGQKESNGSSTSHNSPYSANRRFFDSKIKSGEGFQRPKDEGKFLDAAVEYESKVDLLTKLSSTNGLEMLRVAITADKSDSFDFLKNHVLPLMKVLGSDELSSGMRLRSVHEIVKVIYEAPGFIANLLEKYQDSDGNEFCSSLKDGKINESSSDGPQRKEEEHAMGWFVLTCCKLIDKGKKTNKQF